MSDDATATADRDVLDWLLAGDPAIRWQVMRDLLDRPEAEWRAERARVEAQRGDAEAWQVAAPEVVGCVPKAWA